MREGSGLSRALASAHRLGRGYHRVDSGAGHYLPLEAHEAFGRIVAGAVHEGSGGVILGLQFGPGTGWCTTDPSRRRTAPAHSAPSEAIKRVSLPPRPSFAGVAARSAAAPCRPSARGRLPEAVEEDAGEPPPTRSKDCSTLSPHGTAPRSPFRNPVEGVLRSSRSCGSRIGPPSPRRGPASLRRHHGIAGPSCTRGRWPYRLSNGRGSRRVCCGR